ncbi:MAG: hypothetical protein QW450_02545 [Candidatus Nitrosocaldus sp.]
MHPSQVPVIDSFIVGDMNDAMDAIDGMLQLYGQYKVIRFRVLLPKKSNARSIGYALLNELNLRLRHLFKGSISMNIRYIVYHHDNDHYAMLLLDEDSANTFML